jgi:hypothetical protein
MFDWKLRSFINPRHKHRNCLIFNILYSTGDRLWLFRGEVDQPAKESGMCGRISWD